MSSVSATELAKLGKCEAAIEVGSSSRGWRSGRHGSTRSKSEGEGNDRTRRGNAAHDEFEREARSFSKQIWMRRRDELKVKMRQAPVVIASAMAAIVIIASLVYTAVLGW